MRSASARDAARLRVEELVLGDRADRRTVKGRTSLAAISSAGTESMCAPGEQQRVVAQRGVGAVSLGQDLDVAEIAALPVIRYRRCARSLRLRVAGGVHVSVSMSTCWLPSEKKSATVSTRPPGRAPARSAKRRAGRPAPRRRRAIVASAPSVARRVMSRRVARRALIDRVGQLGALVEHELGDAAEERRTVERSQRSKTVARPRAERDERVRKDAASPARSR
jgi:hypothetical protein